MVFHSISSLKHAFGREHRKDSQDRGGIERSGRQRGRAERSDWNGKPDHQTCCGAAGSKDPRLHRRQDRVEMPCTRYQQGRTADAYRNGHNGGRLCKCHHLRPDGVSERLECRHEAHRTHGHGGSPTGRTLQWHY